MGQENVEVVRAVYAEWAKGNFRAGGDLYDAHFVYIPPANNISAGRYVGRESFGEFVRDWLSAWTNLTVTGEEFIEAENSVVVATHWRAEGRGSGAATEQRDFTVWTFRGLTVIRLEQFGDRADALEAVGLREDDLKPAE